MRPTPLFLTVPLLALLALAAPPAHADSITTTNGVVVTDYTLNETEWAFGGALFRFHLSNPTAVPQRLSLDLETWHDNKLIKTSLELLPGAQSMVEIPIPQVHMSPLYLSVTDSSGKEEQLSLSHGNIINPWMADEFIPLYATPATKPHVFKETLAAAASGKSSSSRKNSEFTLSSAYADPWPADFRAYSRFSACLLTADEFAALPDASRAALLDYAAAGGVLCLFGTSTLPAAPFAVSGETQSGYVHSSIGYGHLVAVKAESAEALSQENMESILEHFKSTYKNSGEDTYKLRSYAIPEMKVELRTAGVFAVLLAFAVLAGPVLLVRLARRNRRIHILWILPAISAGFCLLLVAVFFLSQGVRPTLHLDAVTRLDQRAGRALTTARYTVLTPVSMGGVLDIDRGSIISCLGMESQDRLRFNGPQRISGRTFSPGIPTSFYTRSINPSHLRLEVSRDANGALSVRNLLGCTIDQLELCDENGERHTLTNLASGASATFPDSPPGVFTDGKAGVPTSEHDYVRLPRTYVAEISSDAPFVQDPLPGARAHRVSHNYVFGTY